MDNKLMLAIQNNNRQEIEKLLDQGYDPLFIDDTDEDNIIDSFTLAIQFCPLDILQLLVQRADIQGLTHGQYFDLIGSLINATVYSKVHGYTEHFDYLFEYMKKNYSLEVDEILDKIRIHQQL